MSFCSGRGMAFSKIQILRGAIWQGIWQLALREAVQKVQRIRRAAEELPKRPRQEPRCPGIPRVQRWVIPNYSTKINPDLWVGRSIKILPP